MWTACLALYLNIFVKKHSMTRISLILFGLALGFASFGQKSEKPKVVVGIVVDQMCYEYLYRFQDKFSKGGFLKMMNEGANCRTTQYNYIPTYTGPGHASIYTGTTPSNHGIVANDWYDADLQRSKNCVEDTSVLTIGGAEGNGKSSPRNLKSNTITDQLKLTYNDSKVISVSIKNRGAILPGGHLSDGSYWYDYSTGNLMTSSYYKQSLPEWVKEFNKEKQPAKYMDGSWNTYMDISTYTESGPDDSPYEHLLPGKQKPVFPYDLKTMINSSEVTSTQLFPYTPFANTYLTDFAVRAIDGEQLGNDEVTDMLCISYSTPDIIGHAFGPYSKEIEDTYIRLDRDIERLIKELEERFGKKGFVMFLTADHAVVPVPQFLIDHGLPGGYFYRDQHLNELDLMLEERFGARLIEEEDNLNIFFNKKLIDLLKIDLQEVCAFAQNVIGEWDEVKRVFTKYDLTAAGVNDKWMDMVKNGYHKEESGDILFILEPGYLPESKPDESGEKGTSHGSAYSYDTHVPLLWYGAGIRTQEIFRTIEITDITATLAHILELQLPNATTGEPIVELLK